MENIYFVDTLDQTKHSNGRRQARSYLADRKAKEANVQLVNSVVSLNTLPVFSDVSANGTETKTKKRRKVTPEASRLSKILIKDIFQAHELVIVTSLRDQSSINILKNWADYVVFPDHIKGKGEVMKTYCAKVFIDAEELKQASSEEEFSDGKMFLAKLFGYLGIPNVRFVLCESQENLLQKVV